MTCFADRASSIVTQIVENVQIARDTMRLRVVAPNMAGTVLPGQFFMLRNPAGSDPLIGRAFAVYDVADDDSGWLDVVYIVKGKLTSSLVRLGAADSVALWGPLGNGFGTEPIEHLIMVAGGIGQTPFVALAKEALGKQHFGLPAQARNSGYARKVSLCYGVRSASYLAGVAQFESLGVEVHIAAEDGSLGPPQRVTDLLWPLLQNSAGARIVCCGPEPMMEAVAAIAAERHVDCQVSLETPMACGIGICFTCVAKIGTPDDWDYKRTCVEGPVFDARHIVW